MPCAFQDALQPSAIVVIGLRPAAVALARLRSAAVAFAGLRPAALAFTLLHVTLIAGLLLAIISLLRACGRSSRRYVRMRVVPYRGEDASAEAIVAMFEALHKRLLRRWWRRIIHGQPSVALEIHYDREAWLSLSCPCDLVAMIHSALRSAYPNCRLQTETRIPGDPPVVLRLKKRDLFIKRVKVIDRYEHQREPSVNRLLRTMAACKSPSFVQLALTPAPASFEAHARRLYRRQEARLAWRRGEGSGRGSMLSQSELKGGLEVQHRPLFFTDIRIIGQRRLICERVASELRAGEAENRLIERGTTVRHRLLRLYSGRVQRGEGNPLPSTRRGVFASTELAAIWHLPSIDYANVPIARTPVPLAPAPPGIYRPSTGLGSLRDERGPVSIHPQMRKQNTAVPGTVEQGKSSYLVATVAEDLQRERCAVIVLDPKGDAADAAVSVVPKDRTCTLLDFAHPTCGFNPLAVDAPADVIADYVVAALRNLFDDADIKASSDRYLRNAIIAVLAYDRSSTLWDAARLLSVGQEGYAYRARVGARVRELPELKEISEFFTAELSAQLSDARSMTTAKLDAPVNKLARLLNSPSIKRVLLNDSLTIDFDQVISRGQVLVVKGALGAMGAGNTAVLMQLLVGMLDAALARQQDRVSAEDRVAVALKVDEAPLVLNRGFAETMALKRSAGLETVACWQASAQWSDREVREQLDALFAHRVYFATGSAQDARESAKLMMAQFSDTVRPRIESLSALGHPDARLHLPKHHAIATWTTPAGRQPPFIAQTIPMRIDEQMLAWHARRQAQRGARYKSDLSQAPWEELHPSANSTVATDATSSFTPAPASPRTSCAPAAPGPLPRAPAQTTSPRAPAQTTSPRAPAQTTSPRAPAQTTSPRAPRPPSVVPTPPSPSAAPGRSPAQLGRQPAKLGRPPVNSPGRSPAQPASAMPPISKPPVAQPPAAARIEAPLQRLEPLPAVAAQSYRELVELDGANRARRVSVGRALTLAQLQSVDLEILAMVAGLGYVLSSEIHRRLGEGKALTTTQRRLKRLADAGLIERIQLHRSDGGGVPMCCAVREAGAKALLRHGLLAERQGTATERQGAATERQGTATERQCGPPADALSGEHGLWMLRREVHAAAWCCAYERAANLRELMLEGSAGSVLCPPAADRKRGERAIGPADLRLPGGWVAHQFVQADRAGELRDVSAFETIRPQARIRARRQPFERSGEEIELLIDLDDRLSAPSWAAKVRRYDHFLTGWSSEIARPAARQPTPHVIFVCRDRRRARECAAKADELLIAAQACAGVHPDRWRYLGRERIMFVAERDVHEGQLGGYRLHSLPPQLRAHLSGQPLREPMLSAARVPTLMS